MSPGAVASDGSVTLTLSDAQGMLDGVTLNLSAQVQISIVCDPLEYLSDCYSS